MSEINKNSVDYRVKIIVLEVLGATAPPFEDLKGSTTYQDLGFDSLDSVESVMLLEEEFDIEFPDEDVEKIDSIGGMVSYITRRLGG